MVLSHLMKHRLFLKQKELNHRLRPKDYFTDIKFDVVERFYLYLSYVLACKYWNSLLTLGRKFGIRYQTIEHISEKSVGVYNL